MPAPNFAQTLTDEWISSLNAYTPAAPLNKLQLPAVTMYTDAAQTMSATGTALTVTNNAAIGQLSLGQSSTAVVVATSGTIAVAGIGVSRVAPTGNVTGVILTAGTTAGQHVTVANESAFSVTFAASGTSNVADGVNAVIAATTAMSFVWDSATALWYRAASPAGGAGASTSVANTFTVGPQTISPTSNAQAALILNEATGFIGKEIDVQYNTASIWSLTPLAGQAPAVNTEVVGFNKVGETLTITSGNTGNQRFNVFGQPTVTAATALTVNKAATVAIVGAPAPAGAGPATLTSTYAFWVQAGLVQLDGAGTGLAVANNQTIGGTLAVTGLSTLTGGLTTTANVTTIGTGALSIAGVATITGLATLTGGLTTPANVTTSGTGALSIAGGSTLTGAITGSTSATITAGAAATVPITAKGVALQTGDLLDATDSGNVVQVGIANFGTGALPTWGIRTSVLKGAGADFTIGTGTGTLPATSVGSILQAKVLGNYTGYVIQILSTDGTPVGGLPVYKIT